MFLSAPAYARSQEPAQGSHAHTQMQVAQRIQINSEMLKQMQQIRQLQELQQRQEIQERMQRARQEQDRLFQQRRDVMYQQHQRQQDEIRRQNQMRFIQHMTQQPNQRLQLGQNTMNVQTPLPPAPRASYARPGLAYHAINGQPLSLGFQLPPSVRLAAPATGPIPTTGAPPTINLTLEPATQVTTARTLPSNAQVSRP